MTEVNAVKMVKALKGGKGFMYVLYNSQKYGDGWMCPGGKHKHHGGQIHYQSDNFKSVHKCSYDRRNADGMKKLHSAHKNATPGERGYKDELGRMYDTVKFKFCEDAENRNKNIGEAKCSKIGDTAKLGRLYCQAGDRVKSDDTCRRDTIGSKVYDELSANYCKKTPADEWCACYNVYSKTCDTNKGAAGCAKVAEEHDAILESLPSDKLGEQARRELNNRKTCRANICTGARFIPQNLPGCDLKIDMCIQEVKVAGHAVDTGINMNCDKEGKGGGKDNAKAKGSEAVAATATETKSNTNIIYAFGAFNSIALCCLILLVAAVALSGGSKAK